jgi:hypothetical protein
MSASINWQVQKQIFKTAVLSGCLLLALLAACTQSTSQPATETATSVEVGRVVETSTSSPTPVPTSTLEAAPSPTSTLLPPDFWQRLPVIPEKVSDRVRGIYQNGLALGNNPRVFSRIGDCNSAAPGFLVGFDGNYNLGAYTSLQPAIEYFRGSFKRPSLAAKAGINTAGLLTTLWTDQQCQKNESLLDCQYRIDHPAFAIISIGTNESYYVHQNPDSFEKNLRLIIENTIAQGIIPVLGTKADNLEGNNFINATIARLAMEYELPLWNFWLAAQTLPDDGLADSSHLSTISYINFTDFSIPHSLEYGKQMHNLTALQMLYFLWQQLGQ